MLIQRRIFCRLGLYLTRSSSSKYGTFTSIVFLIAAYYYRAFKICVFKVSFEDKFEMYIYQVWENISNEEHNNGMTFW